MPVFTNQWLQPVFTKQWLQPVFTKQWLQPVFMKQWLQPVFTNSGYNQCSRNSGYNQCFVNTGLNQLLLWKTDWALYGHYQIPWLFQIFQVNNYGVSTLATVAIQNEMHAISHCNTNIYCHNYDNCVLQYTQWNNSLFLFGCNKAMIFCVKNNIRSNSRHARTHFRWLFPDHSEIPWLLQVFPVSGHPAKIFADISSYHLKHSIWQEVRDKNKMLRCVLNLQIK